MNDFMKSKEIVDGCYNQYYNVKEYICASLRAHGAGFFPVSIAQMESHKVNCLTIGP